MEDTADKQSTPEVTHFAEILPSDQKIKHSSLQALKDTFPLRRVILFTFPIIGLFLLFGFALMLKEDQQGDEISQNFDPVENQSFASLPAEDGKLLGSMHINVPTFYKELIILEGGLEVSGSAIFHDPISAPNLFTGISTGAGLASTGGINPTITNTGVLSLGGETGELTLSPGSGISVDGLTITNSDPGSAQRIFRTIQVGSASLEAGSNTDTLTFAAGNGITLLTDTNSNTITITESSLASTSAVLAETSGSIYPVNIASKVGIGTSNPSHMLDVLGSTRITGPLTLTSTLTVGNAIIAQTSGNTINGLVINSGTITSGTWNGSTISPTSGGTGLTSYANGDLLYAASANSLSKLPIGSPGQVLTVSNGIPAWTDVGTTNYFQEKFGAISPINSSSDLLTGASATISAIVRLPGRADQDAFFNLGAGNFGIGTTNPTSTLTVNGAAAITGETTFGSMLNVAGDIAVNTNKFMVTASSGNTSIAGTLGISGNVAVNSNKFMIDAVTGDITVAGTTTLGGQTYTWPSPAGLGANLVLSTDATGNLSWKTVTGVGAGSGTITAVGDVTSGDAFTQTGVGNSLYFHSTTFTGLLTSGALTGDRTYTLPDSNGTICLTSGNCAGSTNYWTQDLSNGVLYPKYTTLDITLGGSATSSAKFAFLNNNSGTPLFYTSGNIGLGTKTVGSKLQINGNAAIGYNASTAAPANGLAVAGNVGIGTTTVNNQLVLNTPMAADSLATAIFTTSASTKKALVLQGFSGQTANLQEWQTADGNEIASISQNQFLFNDVNSVPSYNNSGGTGNRTGLITVSTTFSEACITAKLVDGNTAAFDCALSGFQAVTGKTITFDFGAGATKVINEVKWYNSNATSHGTWQWRGSNDGSTWVNIGGTFTLGGSSIQTQTTLAGNATGYRYYQLLGVSGTLGSVVFMNEVEFKIAGHPSISGSTYIAGGYVGIGTSTLTHKLNVSGTVPGKALAMFNETDNNDIFTASASGSTKFVINNAGNVGIGTSTPGSKLTISGLGTSAGTALVADANGNVFLSSSSERYKENIHRFSTDFGKLLELEPKAYTYKLTGTKDIGFLAEDLHTMGLADLVIYDNQGRPDAIKYDRFSTYFVEILKDHNSKLLSFQSQFSQPESTTIKFEDSINELTTSLEKQKNDIVSLSEKIEKLENLELVNLSKLSSSTESAVMGDNLLVLGTSTLREATVIEALAVGTTLHITPSSINTLEELSIQPFKQGAIDLMAGAVRIETDGTVTFAENVEFAKDIAVKGAITTSTVAAKQVSIEQDTIIDLTATESTTSASVGQTTITAGKTKRKINTPFAKADSLIYVTPEGKTGNQTLYIAEKKDGYFVVAIEEAITSHIKFNFFIVNQSD